MYHVIVNPRAQSGRTGKLWRKIEARLNEKGAEYEVVKAQSAGDLMGQISRMTESAGDGAEAVKLLVIGGDGTLNDVVNSIGDFSRVQVGLIPSGSGNDFARDLKLSRDKLGLLDTILEGKVRRRLDVGTLIYEEHEAPVMRENDRPFRRERRFAVSSGIGFDAAVCAAAEESPVKKVLNRIGLGKLIYLFMAVKVIIGNKKCAVRLILDDEKVISLDSCLLAAFMNHGYEGGGFYFAPEASAEDGILDLCVAGDISKKRFFAALPFAMVGKHYRFKGVDAYRAKKVRVESGAPLWVHMDGETEVKAKRLLVGCLRGVLQMLN